MNPCPLVVVARLWNGGYCWVVERVLGLTDDHIAVTVGRINAFIIDQFDYHEDDDRSPLPTPQPEGT